MPRTGWKKLKKERGIYRNPKGALRVRALHIPEHGPRKEKQVTLPKGTPLDEAILLRNQLEAQLAQQAMSERPSRGITLSDYAEHWLEAKARRVRKSTQESYFTPLVNHILPFLGEMRVEDISRADIDRWVGWAEKARRNDGKLYAHESVKTWFKVLLIILRDATVELNLPDPTIRVTPPTRQEAGGRRETRTLSPEELGEILEHVALLFSKWHTEALVLAYSGLRAGELYALKFEDIDEERRVLHIRRSTARGQTNLVKTYEPRDAVVPQLVIDAIKAHKKEMMADHHKGLKSGLVFPSVKGTPRTPSGLRNVLVKAAKAAGLEIHVTPQVLRRTYNTLLVEAKVDRLVLRSMIGHTTERMTSKYAGIRYDQKNEASTRLLKLVQGES